GPQGRRLRDRQHGLPAPLPAARERARAAGRRGLRADRPSRVEPAAAALGDPAPGGERAMTLASWLHPSRRPRVLLVGDIMLDRSHYGETERVSPEAPVVVLAATREELLLGGCGNVAANLAALGAEVSCVAVTGRDEAATRVRELLGRAGLQA